jgi:hypothetical protein
MAGCPTASPWLDPDRVDDEKRVAAAKVSSTRRPDAVALNA